MTSIFITKFHLFSSKKLVLLLFCLSIFCGCEEKVATQALNSKLLAKFSHYQSNSLIIDEELIIVIIAKSSPQLIKGLSGLAEQYFAAQDAMLFYGIRDEGKSFWMPDTYFDLDIFFLDKDFKIIDVERKVPHHPGMQEPPQIARTRLIYARHVFEMRADSKYSQSLRIGDVLKWLKKLR